MPTAINMRVTGPSQLSMDKAIPCSMLTGDEYEGVWKVGIH